MPATELQQYAASVIDRFKNPYIDHYWLTISLNSFAKWKVRLLPSLLRYVEQQGAVPPLLSFSLASLIRFYQGSYRGESIALNDEPQVLERLQVAWQAADSRTIARQVLDWEAHWGQNLSTIPGLVDQVANYLDRLEQEEISAIIQSLC
jgi:tagaturonate reductase